MALVAVIAMFRFDTAPVDPPGLESRTYLDMNSYRVPVGESPEFKDRNYHVGWNDGTPKPYFHIDATEEWTTKKVIHVTNCPTPDVFHVFRRATQLQVLDLGILQPGNRCVFTGVNLLPALRSLSLSVERCELVDCQALAHASGWYTWNLKAA